MAAQNSNTHSLSYRWARLISDLFNPLILPPLLITLIGWEFDTAATGLIGLFTCGLLFFTIIPFAILRWLIHNHHIDSWDVRDRMLRDRPYLLSISSFIVGALVVHLLPVGGLRFIRILLFCYILNSIAGYLINHWWKISIHSASAGTTAVVLLVVYIYGTKFSGSTLGFATVVLFLLLLPIMMWSRYRLNIHTAGQVVGGAVLSIVLTTIELWLMI